MDIARYREIRTGILAAGRLSGPAREAALEALIARYGQRDVLAAAEAAQAADTIARILNLP
jgi:hypothetical protein